MLLRAVAHWEAGLHGVELMPGLDLRHDQRYRCTMMDAMEGDVLNASRNVVEASIDKGAPGIDDIHSHVRR